MNGCTAAALLLYASAATAGDFTIAGGGIVGSKHDMNMYGSAVKDVSERVCAFCHTPHHAIDPSLGEYLPLWVHKLSSLNFNAYRSLTAEPIADAVRGPTRLCMSCHDGTIAIDTHYGIDIPYGIDGAVRFLPGDAYHQPAVAIQGNLTTSHPVGIDYTDVLERKSGLHPITGTFIGNTVSIASVLYEERYVTCATCHDVHNRSNVSGSPDEYNYFIYAREERSELCLSCHDKQ